MQGKRAIQRFEGWWTEMNLARVSSGGQVTVPAEVRRELNLRAGDKIIFFRNPQNEIVVENASACAVRKAHAAMAGVAERIGVKDDE
jgi:AbrB family looped-hinge helix DNA binding protein